MHMNFNEYEFLQYLRPPRADEADPPPAEAPAQPAVRVALHGLHKHYGARHVLKGLDLDIAPGEFVAVVGRSGCGKSTLLRLLAGLETPSAQAAQQSVGAAVRFDGVAQSGADDRVRIMFQDARLLPWKRVLDNVAIGMPPRARGHAAAVLRQVGLGERAGEWPAALSGGQKQRVALARALLHRPGLLLLDEPLGALDALTRMEMQQLIEDLWQRDGFTAVLVTHDVNEAVALADRVVVIEEGSIVLDQHVSLARPRNRGSAAFAALEGRVLDAVLERGHARPAADKPLAPVIPIGHLRLAV
ncbi:ATP-binding cassette domain-containing protein [Bordetella sp. BOR01]|uniref:ATP-binding cassette domain-containing protein n=1 Tax=Bordetella sp. BOR01 TaxID=2854779 RepID=UPI001C490170|nr:ATP-binding cassette domain-containing protein [Bordetella sp. BOR01]MBV7486102.1 ATP-binding cassette domain-containing protein [Bordetella sp. BOR01]